MTRPGERGEPEEITFGRTPLPGSADPIGYEHVELPDTRRRWHRPGRDRTLAPLALVLLAVVSICALLVAAIVVWRTTEPSSGAHGLEPDQAACFAFGTIERRMGITVREDEFEQLRRRPPEGRLRAALRDEVRALDRLGDRFPEADYRLVAAFSQVGDQSTEAVHAFARPTSSLDFLDALGSRRTAIGAAERRCREAGFDAETLEPTTR